MKLKFLIFETKVPDWVASAREEFARKIAPFCPIEIQSLKSPSGDRDQAAAKKKKEGELLLKAIDASDLLVLFDEGGRAFPHSEEFSNQLKRLLESGKSRLVFVIGGPYGFDEAVVKRSQARWSLSGLTYNHLIAQLVALEQIYRGFTLIKGIPYHNR